MDTSQACPERWLDGGSAGRELDYARRIMSARSRGPQQLIAGRRNRHDHRLALLGDERLPGVLSEEDPIYRLNVIIVLRSVQGQMLIRQQPRMGVRHRCRMAMVWIAPMHVGERRLSEAEEQRKASRDCRRSPQDSFQCMLPLSGLSTKPSPARNTRAKTGQRVYYTRWVNSTVIARRFSTAAGPV